MDVSYQESENYFISADSRVKIKVDSEVRFRIVGMKMDVNDIVRKSKLIKPVSTRWEL